MAPRSVRTKHRHAAFLRGINVGGKHKLPMAELAALFRDAGCEDVRTYIQSGNVAFTAKPAVAKQLPARIAAAIEEAFGFGAPITIRSAAELRDVVAANPFLAAGCDPAQLHVAFLSAKPRKPCAQALDPERSPGDAFHLRGRELYLQLPNGVGRSKLTNAYLDRTLEVVSTARNWRTTLAVLALVEGD